jgi:hypothetical protein
MLITEHAPGCRLPFLVPFQGVCDQSVVPINRLVIKVCMQTSTGRALIGR